MKVKKKVKLKQPPLPNRCAIKKCSEVIPGPVKHLQKSKGWKKSDPSTQIMWYICDRCMRKGRVKK